MTKNEKKELLDWYKSIDAQVHTLDGLLYYAKAEEEDKQDKEHIDKLMHDLALAKEQRNTLAIVLYSVAKVPFEEFIKE